MFKGWTIGTVRIYGTQEILNSYYSVISEYTDVKELLLTDNFLQFYHKDTYEAFTENKKEFQELVEGVYQIDAYKGIKFTEAIVESITDKNFYRDNPNYDTWEKDVYDKNSFISEYTAYINSPEYTQQKQQRKVNKLEKILAKQKERLYTTA